MIRRGQICAWLGGSWLLAGTLWAGQLAAQDDGRSLVNAAYQKSQSASTAEDYSEIIDLCQQAQAARLSKVQGDYVKQLLGWTYNRRGEAYADQAAKSLESGDKDRAAQLDAKALQDFEAAIENDPQRWKAIHNRGVSFAVVGKYEEALADFSRVIELNRDYVNTWFNRGEIRYELGQFEQAIADYTQALRLKPRDAGALTSRGHAFFQLRRFRESLNDYNQAVQLNAESAVGYANRGDAYQSLGMWEQAASDYRQAIRLDGRSARAYQSAAWLMATCPDARYRNTELAVQAAEKAIELEGGKDYKYLDTLAAAYANAGRFDQAKSNLGKAIELAPSKAVQALQRRLERYERGQPYRQGGNETASSQGTGDTR